MLQFADDFDDECFDDYGDDSDLYEFNPDDEIDHFDEAVENMNEDDWREDR